LDGKADHGPDHMLLPYRLCDDLFTVYAVEQTDHDGLRSHQLPNCVQSRGQTVVLYGHDQQVTASGLLSCLYIQRKMLAVDVQSLSLQTLCSGSVCYDRGVFPQSLRHSPDKIGAYSART